MKFNSVFFFCVLLCLTLGSLSCSESKNAQLDRKLLDVSRQGAERVAKEECSEKNLSETDCAKLREASLSYVRESTREVIKYFDEECKKTSLFEEQCVERKQKLLQIQIDKVGKSDN
jgi:hypothetical protein